MGLALTQVVTEDRASGGQIIDGSLRFDSASSHYLNRTPGSAGNRRTWTWSGWAKRGKSNVLMSFLGVNANVCDDLVTRLQFNSSNQLVFDDFVACGSTHINLITTQVFRDPSAWIHIVVAVDTTQGTAANRAKLYVNGSQVTAFATETYPTQNQDTAWNSTLEQRIGRDGDPNYLDGYLAEVNFIDGSALDHEDFGEYDGSGVWRPIKYTGSYGTNGFYLKFDSTATNGIGHDHSGNGNNFTPSGFDTTTYDSDVVIDTPTKNFATLNPLIGHDPNGLQRPIRANGNLQTTSGLDPYDNGRIDSTTILRPVAAGGTFKYEFKLLSQLNHAAGWVAWDPENFSSEVGGAAPAWVSTRTSPSGGGTSTAYTSSGTVAQDDYTDVAINDIVTVTIDLDNSTASWYVNGTRKGHMTGCNFSDYEYITTYMREATRTQASATLNCNFGQKAFQYTGVSGDAWGDISTLPSPAIKDGSDYFNTVTYAGNGGSNTITTGMDHSSGGGLLWIKNRTTTANHDILDNVRGLDQLLELPSGAAEYTYTSSNLAATSTGYTLNTSSGQFNASSNNYVAWNWLAGGSTSSNTDGSITSTVSANPSAGFSIVSYTGNGTVGASIGHGLGVAPNMIITKARDLGSSNWKVYHSSIGATKFLILTSSNAAGTFETWGDTSPTSTVFYVGDTYDNVKSGTNYIAYCFAEVEGYSKFGSYQGNGNADGSFIHLGFKPAWIMIKNSTTAQGWYISDNKRDTYNQVNGALFASSASAESTASTGASYDFLSNGFKPRTSNNDSNGSGDTYIYMAFAEHPFGGEGVSPATAR